jgi:hypothetical protein
LAQFNNEVYSGQKRDLICATIVKYGEIDDTGDCYPWTFEMVATDPLLPETCERVAIAVQKLQHALSLGTLHVRATSQNQVTNLAKPGHPLAKFPQCDSVSIWKGQTYGCLVDGTVSGFVRYIKDANNMDEIESLKMNDIVFFERGIPNDLPSVAAVVFGEHLPPLCHISLLCRSRKTPCCFDTKPATLHQFAELAGKKVTFTSGNKLTKAVFTFSEYDAGVGYNTPNPNNLDEPSATNTMPLRFENKIKNIPAASEIGAKARQCGLTNILLKQLEFHSKSFAIPMGAYIRHVAPLKGSITTLCQRHRRCSVESFPSISA